MKWQDDGMTMPIVRDKDGKGKKVENIGLVIPASSFLDAQLA